MPLASHNNANTQVAQIPVSQWKERKCLRRTKGGKKKKERKKKTQHQLSGVAFLMKPFFPTVLPPKWEESRGRQEGGILYSDDSKEDFHSCDDGM